MIDNTRILYYQLVECNMGEGKRARVVPAAVLLTWFLNSTILLADSFSLRHHPYRFGRPLSRFAITMKTPMDGLSQDSHVAMDMDTVSGPGANSSTPVVEPPISTSSSLAGPYRIDCTKRAKSSTTESIHEWSLSPLQHIPLDRNTFSSEGGEAWAALMLAQNARSRETISSLQGCLRAMVDATNHSCRVEWSLTDSSSSSECVDNKLISVLARIFCQWAIRSEHDNSDTSKESKDWTITLPDEQQQQVFTISTTDFVQAAVQLFEKDATGSEMVEMVDQKGRLLGYVPRKLVHQYNLLHRGIGLFVTKDVPIDKDSIGNNNECTFPDLYVHRRTDTKRIFPSLYDMFVGGVSTAGEDARVTASREVAEELGLSLCDDDESSSNGHLSKEPILQCVVCTAYNRCVVDLFAYCMDTTKEQVHWQEEEVAWGSFVPYSIVEAAADRSILRLAERNEWPGAIPPIQSSAQGKTDEIVVEYEGAWQHWDFVPDGLLVWEAWLRELERTKKV